MGEARQSEVGGKAGEANIHCHSIDLDTDRVLEERIH